ncbi:MAG: type II toxin-antitoxin system VapC family toxin [Bryobacterales bacterium]|nr:type II toxin-antitoxin system VapC family toxin [Bryobacterales bacterium]
MARTKPTVYVETTIISHLAARPSRHAKILELQVETHQWWNLYREDFLLLVSALVTKECTRGDAEAVQRRLALLAPIEQIPITEGIMDVAGALVGPGALPPKAIDDAVHIATAFATGCDYLLTWNLRHIANSQIRREVERILRSYGYTKTRICTPKQLSTGA